MVKNIKTIVKLQIPAGQANPAPPVGPALGQHGLNILDFCQKFNAQTKDKGKTIIPVEITVYEDRTFDFRLKTPPAAILLKQALNLEKGSATAGKEKVGKISKSKIQEIAKIKMPDLNTSSLEEAARIIEGTAKSMGIQVIK